MYASLIIDFSRVLIFSYKDVESLNEHHEKMLEHTRNYQALDHFYLNDQLLIYLEEINRKINIFLFSDGNLHDLPDIKPRLIHIFKEVVTAESIGYKKTDPRAYRKLTKYLNINPKATLFLDDKDDNVGAASAAGLKAIKFKNNDQTIASLQGLLQ